MCCHATTSKRQRGGASVSGVIALVFLVLVVWFLAGPNLARVPRGEPANVPPSELSIEPLRVMQGDPPRVFLGGFDRQCMECHRFFQPVGETARQLVQHVDIVMDHGLNDRCANCHRRDDLHRLVLRGNQTVPFTRSHDLCAACHGPTFRDWERGMHGKTTGYWDRTRGDARRLSCVECHDPHAPAFPSMRPLPGPNTLRMVLTAPRAAAHESPLEQIDPLRKWHYEELRPLRPAPRPLVPPPPPLGEGAVTGEK